MRPVLGFQLELDPPPVSAVEGADWFYDRFMRWARSWYERRGIQVSDGVSAEEPLGLPLGHQMRAIRESPSADEFLIDVEWQYPADGDPTALWTSRATIAADSTGADLSLSLAIASREFVARPFAYDVYVPRLLPELAKSGRVQLNGRPITASPRSLGVGGVTSFVESDLQNSKRRLPIVLVARVGRDEHFPIDPAKLATALCGIAEVWVLADRWSAYALSRHLGNRLSCYDGGIRTYWPQFDLADDPLRHPLITAARRQELEAKGVDVERYLTRHIAPVAALRLGESARAVSLRAAMRDVRRAHAKAAVESSIAQGKVGELETQVLEAWDKIETLDRQLAEQRERAETAERDLADVRQNFALVAAAAAGDSSISELVEESAVVIPDTVSAALNSAENENPILNVWPSARESAAGSRYARPEQVYQALEAIAEVGDLYFTQQKTKKSIGNLEALFGDRGFQYAPSDSQTTTTKYGKERTFSNGDRRFMFTRHLTLGGGDRQNCLQVYFEFDSATSRVDVGYCGTHLPYDGMRS